MPISTSKEFIGKSHAGLYGDVIETLDWSVGEILSVLKKEGIDNFTIHIEKVVREKYEKVQKLSLVKNESLEKGRE
ncbi:hypothetical protein [Labilibaculum sp.]|uniref:hypothetical protein n=1 Tax=Labilibaculum sp. TaxID=2060723 RepID=UPI00356968C4